MVLFIIAVIIGAATGVFCAIITPPSPKSRTCSCGGRRKSKGFIGTMMGRKRAGVMCGPGGSKRRR